MRGPAVLAVAIVMVLGTACTRAGGAGDDVRPAQTAPPPALDTAEPRASISEVLAEDLEAVADAHGWSQAEVETYHHAAQVVGEIAQRIHEERPDAFVGSALADAPTDPPTIYVKGSADDFILGLVEAAGIEIILADNQPFSFDELEVRNGQVAEALLDIGFESFGSGVDITRGILELTITREPGLPSTGEEVLSALPSDLRSSVEITMTDEPVVEPEGDLP